METRQKTKIRENNVNKKETCTIGNIYWVMKVINFVNKLQGFHKYFLVFMNSYLHDNYLLF